MPQPSGALSPTLLLPRFTTAALLAQLRRMPPHEFANVSLRHLTAWCHVIEAFTNFEWVANNVLAHVRGDLSATGFLQMQPTAPDIQRELKSNRVYDLAELLFNLQLIENFDHCARRLSTGDAEQIEATYAELQFAKLLYSHEIPFRFVDSTTAAKGEGYDFELILPPHPVVCADAKAKMDATLIDPPSIRNSFNKARTRNLPKDKPGIIFMKVPQHWFGTPDMAAQLDKVAADFLRNTQRVVSIKFYVSHYSFQPGWTLHQHAYREITNPRTRFAPRNWDLFKGFHVPAEWQGVHPTWTNLTKCVENATL